MTLGNIHTNPRFTHYLIEKDLFKNTPMMIVDVGARGGVEDFSSLYRDQVRRIGFEPDKNECEKLNSKCGPNDRYLPYALYRETATIPFYVTKCLPASGIYKPDSLFIQRIHSGDNLSVVQTIPLECRNFDSIAGESNIEYVDYMKIDTEGSESDVLKGAERFLDGSILAVNSEVWLQPAHENQPLFGDFDSFIRKKGFYLFDIKTYRHERAVLPMLTNQPAYTSFYGQAIWSQALYMRDGVREILTQKQEAKLSEIQILKLVSLMEIFKLYDCAIELMIVALRNNLIKGLNGKILLDLLTPPVSGNTLTYAEYIEFYKRVRTMRTEKPVYFQKEE